MAATELQNYKNHARFVPLYHFVLSLLLLVFFLWRAWALIKNPGAQTVMGLVLAVSLVLMFYYTRAFPLAVQDRLIRLEMRLRLHQVLPEELRGRIDELDRDQLIGLRFASDAELTGLVESVLAGEVSKRNDIKKRVKDWQGDYFRC